MKHISLLILLFSFFILLCPVVHAQQSQWPVINGEFKNLAASRFINELEIQTGYHFYYDTTGFDSLTVDLIIKDQPLPEVLNLAFAHTEYKHTLYNKAVFITKGTTIATTLPDDFFARKSKTPDTAATPGDLLTDFEEDTKPQIAALENKLYEIGIKTQGTLQGTAKLAGYVRDITTGEPVPGAAVFSDKLKISVTSDQFGYYSITLPKGRHMINIQSLGKKDTWRQVMLYADGNLNIDMRDHILSLKAVVISAKKAANINSLQMGLEKVDIRTIKQIPVAFGEADILKVVQTLPGVKTVGEASTGFNVRGGSADQNLILFNDATIYNPSHFFGFFSAFNPDVVSSVELYKSSIPAKYGGRLSSVLDVVSREGNKKKITGSAGIGLLTSRINVEGPLQKDRTSFIIGGRTTYANWLLQYLPNEYKHSKASFNDVNLLISHKINDKNDLYLTGYLSNDRFNLNSDTVYGYGNKNISLKWKHVYNNKLQSLVTAGYDAYGYKIYSEENPVNAYTMKFDINQTNFKLHFNYFVNSKHTLDFGLNSIYYTLHPGSFGPRNEKSLVAPEKVNAEHALESAVYVTEKYNITSALSLQAGLRFSLYNYVGPNTVYHYAPGLPKELSNITDTLSYAKGKFINNYKGPEYRLSLRYAFTDNFSVKAGYNSLRQYIHMLSNTTAMAPTDIWKLSDPNIKPQYGEQVSVGLYKNFKSNTIETSAEVYYKSIKDYLDYKSGAVLVLNEHIETDVFNTSGKAYGVELMVKKLTGKLNGWISYTWSRTLLKMNDPSIGEVINDGAFYPANYDKPHELTFIGNYRFSHRYSFSLNTTYSTGRPITIPIGRYYYEGSMRALYSDRNAYRIPDYFRTDISLNIEGNHKVKQKIHNSWTFGVYNLLGRKNPYSVYFVSENGVINGYKLSIFGAAIIYANFNIRF
ncbi:MAG TPA: TonB-dependent receptor plug domain-containing protein [Agriterribacter sp.]|uniref:TonB-dependent receptor n=1 Tax=Agriterribacter sp. TaxID=2821509 RepID=UPI002D07EAA4|nr:carboxypeptidase-like regulatory domain-containing protein [Agriterribacter sp.]HRQ18409.1 TonB-dependent receptor plug domain-containing protein [Agriterribacter sp.]